MKEARNSWNGEFAGFMCLVRERIWTLDLLIRSLLTEVFPNLAKSQNVLFMRATRHGNFKQFRGASSYSNPYGV